MIAAEDWLVEMAQTDLNRHEIGKRLVRMQLRTQRTSGHIVYLGTEYLRRHIRHAARHGDMAQVNVPCSRCGCIARLSDWVRSSAMTDDERQTAYVALRGKNPAWRCHFLADCPGPSEQQDLFDLLGSSSLVEEVLP